MIFWLQCELSQLGLVLHINIAGGEHIDHCPEVSDGETFDLAVVRVERSLGYDSIRYIEELGERGDVVFWQEMSFSQEFYSQCTALKQPVVAVLPAFFELFEQSRDEG